MTSQPPCQHYPPAQAPAVDQEPQAQQQAKRSKGLSWLVEIAVTVILALALYWVIQTFVVQTYRVEGPSMDDTLTDGQHLLIDKLTPRFDSYSRGDIIVFHPPDMPADSTPYIKRVIGVAGDHIRLHDGVVLVNGVALHESYLSDDGPHHGATEPIEPDFQTSWDVPVGTVFAMGDHRADSVDSRAFGTVAVDQIIGPAWLRFWPFDGVGILQVPTYPGVPDAPVPAAAVAP